MGGSLMLGMVPGMFDRLSLCQSAYGKNTEHQEDRQEFEDAVVHRKQPNTAWPNVTGGLPGLSRWRLDGGSCLVYLVCLVCLVCSVYLDCPIYLVSSPKHTRQTE